MSMKKKVVISKKPCSRCGSTMWHFAGQKFPEKLNLCAGCIARSELASKAGITAIVEQGGSVNDKASIDAADAAGIPIVFTGERKFWH